MQPVTSSPDMSVFRSLFPANGMTSTETGQARGEPKWEQADTPAKAKGQKGSKDQQERNARVPTQLAFSF